MTSFDNIENDDRPKTPTEQDCCGNACNPCIFDIHKKLLEKWKKERYNKIEKVINNYLSFTRYNKFIITNITKGSEDCIFIHLDCASENREDIILLSPSQHIIIKLTSISKPYTPICWSKKNMTLLIKLYPNGKASTCIKQLKIGNELFIRGPYGDFKYIRNSYKNIIMLSIGSGIAALYPLAISIVEDTLDDTKINMMLGFRSLLHVPLKDELRLLTDYWNFECTLCLSEKSSINVTGINIVNDYLNQKVIEETLDSYLPETSLVLICGTSEFNQTVEKFVQEKYFNHYYIFR